MYLCNFLIKLTLVKKCENVAFRALKNMFIYKNRTDLVIKFSAVSKNK